MAIRRLMIMVALMCVVFTASAGPSGQPFMQLTQNGWSTKAVQRAMNEIRAQHGGSMIRQQSTGQDLLVQWRTPQGTKVFVIDPRTGRWSQASRRHAHPGG